MRNVGLVRHLAADVPCRPEELAINTAGETMYASVLASFTLVKAFSAGKDQIGPLEKLCLSGPETLRRATKPRKLVHAVVNGHFRLEVAAEVQCKRGVIPGNEIVNRKLRQQLSQKTLLNSARLYCVKT